MEPSGLPNHNGGGGEQSLNMYQLVVLPPVSPSPTSTLPVPTTPVDDDAFVLSAGFGSGSDCGGGGGGATATAAFCQTKCAVKSCQQLIVKQPSRPGVTSFAIMIMVYMLVLSLLVIATRWLVAIHHVLPLTNDTWTGWFNYVATTGLLVWRCLHRPRKKTGSYHQPWMIWKGIDQKSSQNMCTISARSFLAWVRTDGPTPILIPVTVTAVHIVPVHILLSIV